MVDYDDEMVNYFLIIISEKNSILKKVKHEVVSPICSGNNIDLCIK